MDAWSSEVYSTNAGKLKLKDYREWKKSISQEALVIFQMLRHIVLTE